MAGKSQRLHSLPADTSSRGSAAAQPTSSPAPATSSAPRVNSKPTRTTLVLAPVEYRALKRFVADVEQETELTGVAASEVCRVLLGMLAEDDDLKRRVRDQLIANGGNRRH